MVLLAPFSLFVSVYLATFLAAAWAARLAGISIHQWLALFAVTVATVVSIASIDRGKWDVGLSARLPSVFREFVSGSVFAAVLIFVGDGLIVATTAATHTRGRGFPWASLLVVFVPAAVHEELLFRGYLFQKLRASHREFAIVFSALVFGALHMGNKGVTWLAGGNLVLAGVLLALAYERFRRLWFPIGIHLTWNVLSGPVLGHEVSGYSDMTTVLRTIDRGPWWLTGGSFGIEGSAWMAGTELLAVLWLMRSNAARAGESGSGSTAEVRRTALE